MAKEYFQKNIIPRLYAYTTNQYKDTIWTGEKAGKGLLKIGYTEREVLSRIREQFPIQTPDKKPFEVLLDEVATTEDGKFFDDHLLHKRLVEKGFKRVNGEWFECEIKDVLTIITEIKKGKSVTGDRHQTFGMRPEQSDAVNVTAEYFTKYPKTKKNPAPHFLWNAKMRFGKTFTAYQLAKKMNWKRVLVLTYKPAVESAWREDLQSHTDFEGWQFISRNHLPEKIIQNKPLVWFASFQDVIGKDKDGNIKERLEELHLTEWDCVVMDEYHFGAWRDSAKDFYDKETAKEAELDKEEEIDRDTFPLEVNNYLYLSGTPFRAVATGEFMENQIYNWTYSDEQRAKENWGNNDNNPYLELPQIVLMTYQLPEKVREVAIKGERDGFDLSEFFRAKEIEEKGKKVYKFEYENQVQQWLNIIRGSDQIYAPIVGQDNTRPPIPFEDARLLAYLNHTFWFLPSVASCKAMAEMLKRPNNVFYHDYTVVISAGSEAGIGVHAIAPVKEAIGNGMNTKTIALSCGKLTTGVSIPAWSGIFILRSTTSPETYFQAAFRVQTPWYLTNKDGDSPNKKEILKPKCYIFDFAPNRALSLISEYSSRLDFKDTRTAEQRVQDFLNFLPVLCFDGSSMQSLNAKELLDIAVTGVASTMLAKRWQSAQLIDVSNITLERLLNDKDLLESLMKIEAFRNLNKDISKVISSEKDIKNLVKEKGKENLTKKEEKEIKETEKENQGFKKVLREKLLKFITRVPVFMYLTDYREETLKHVITNLEPDLFIKVTGLTISDFEKMCDIGVFNATNINSAIFAFRRYEEASLNYVGGNDLLSTDMIGGFDTKLSRDEIKEVLEGVK